MTVRPGGITGSKRRSTAIGGLRPYRCAPLGPKRSVKRQTPYLLPAVLALFSILLLFVPPLSAYTITNTVTVQSSLGGPLSASVTVTVPDRTAASIELLQYAPSVGGAEPVTVNDTEYRNSSGTFALLPLPAPTPVGSSVRIDLSVNVPLVPARLFHLGEPVFVRLTDADQNLDPAVAETVRVTLASSATGDTEIIRIRETGPDTGVFTGYIQTGNSTVTAYNGRLTVQAESPILASYTDAVDTGDTTSFSVLVDPFGILFDSRTGAPVDGATVTLIDDTTGLEASVIGDDGVSSYPASVVSGAAATDSGGNGYDFPPGGYRFPFVPPGTYRLQIVPPASYAAPSTVPNAELQSLPGAPFAVVDPGSRGEPFTLNPGPAFHIDIPLDPIAGELWLQKSAGSERVSAGDFLPYRLNLENLADFAIGEVLLEDRLPLGFRYQGGSARIGGIKTNDPEIGRDGRTLTFAVGDLGVADAIEVTYVVEVSAGAQIGQAVNTAQASGMHGSRSNAARAAVTVEEAFFSGRSVIVGRVIADNCRNERAKEDQGLEGVRIFLEDGTFAVTDRQGMYHFEGVRPGGHVVQLDTETLPEGTIPVACDPNTRRAGSAISQFVDLQGGSLWRADFHLQRPQAKPGIAALELTSGIGRRTVAFRFPLEGDGLPMFNRRLRVTLPAETTYLIDTGRLNDRPLAAPRIDGTSLLFALGDGDGYWQAELEFRADTLAGGKAADRQAFAVLIYDRPPLTDLQLPVAPANAIETGGRPDWVLRSRFDPLSAELNPADKAALDRMIEDLGRSDTIRIHVSGHSDSLPISDTNRGIYADNYQLSMARARNVSRYIARKLNLKPDQISLVGKGPDEPLASNATARGRAANRRVEVRVKTGRSEPARVKAPSNPAPGPPKPELITEQTAVAGTLIEKNDQLEYDFDIQLSGNGVEMLRRRLVVELPPRVAYLVGSSRIDARPAGDPRVADSRLVYDLGDAGGTWSLALNFNVLIDADARPGELITYSRLYFDTRKTRNEATPPVKNILLLKSESRAVPRPEVMLQPRFEKASLDLSQTDRRELAQLTAGLRDTAIDHVFVTYEIGRRNDLPPEIRSRYGEDYALSMARALTVANYLAAELNLAPTQITVVGKSAGERLTKTQTSAPGRIPPVHVRVLSTGKERKLTLKPVQVRDWAVIQTRRLEPGAAPGNDADANGNGSENGTQTADLRDGILSPVDNDFLAGRITSVRTRLDSRLKPRLYVDEQEVSPDRIGFRIAEEGTGKTIYSYIGVDLGPAGRHSLRLQGIGPFGNVRFEDRILVQRTGEVAAIRLLEASGNVADGKTPVRLQLQLLDAAGNPIAARAELEVHSGDLEPLRTGDALSVVRPDGKFVGIDRQGWAYFAPVERSGRYRLELGYGDIRLAAETYVNPELRDWILVGYAEGSLGYNLLDGNMDSLAATDLSEDFYEDGRIAFYAKGKIKGQWLLTLAYDSEKAPAAGDGLFGQIDPQRYYAIYGDGSRQQYDAASREKLYVKLERDAFYALYGDYQTDLTRTELSRYDRSLTGVKTELHSRHLALDGFASRADQAFVKDEIRGDGTSGLYRLSRNHIIVNSEKITIEVRDRFRNDIILKSTALSRFTDYSIDYEDGSLFFKMPVPSKDEQLNPVFIVVDYETGQTDSDDVTFGGRGAVSLLEDRIEAGASFIHEGVQGAEGDLIGVDARVDIGSAVRLQAEAATSRSENAGVESEGNAYLAELAHQSRRLAAKLYYREQEPGFGLGQQNGGTAGMRNMGIEGALRLTRDLSLDARALRQRNLITEAERDAGELSAQYKREHFALRSGFLYAEDRFADDTSSTSEQVTAGGNLWLFDRRVGLRAEHLQSINAADDNPAYPTRTIIGADVKLNRNTTLFGEQEFTSGGDTDTQSARAGLKTTPWQGGRLGSSVERQINENGRRVLANFGLAQKWQVTPSWSVDASVDSSQTVGFAGPDPVNPNVPLPSGGPIDFTAVSLGTAYRQDHWLWNIRLEHRWADNADKRSLTSGIFGEPSKGLGLGAALKAFQTEADTGDDHFNGDLRLSLAYRPLQSRWIVLQRLDFVFDEQDETMANRENWRIINNLSANARLGRKGQLSLFGGLKFVEASFDADTFSGFTDLVGIETRYDIAPKWDLGLRVCLLHGWNSGQLDYAGGLSVGRQFHKNIWVSLGYNVTGFTDTDFAFADYTTQGFFMKFRLKMDQQTVSEVAKWVSGK